jgi:hypothetical protein
MIRPEGVCPTPLWVDLPGRFIIVDGRFVEVEPGGKETGQKVTHMIEQGGRFERACITYLAVGDAFLYHDRAGDR